jgi:hypothetical protein
LVGGITLLRPIAKWLWVNQEIRINMTKNMTRKGLAFGAGIALVASGLGAAPAQAAGIQDDAVVLVDTQEHGSTTMLTSGYIDLSASFSGAAQSGSELKLYVSDRSAISVVDNAQQGTNTDTIVTPTLTAYAQLQGTTDQIVLGFGAASGIEDGDAIDAAANFGVAAPATAGVVTFLQSPTQVASVKEVAAGVMTTYSSTAKATDDAVGTVTFTVTKAGHGIDVGDIVLITTTDADATTDDATQYETAFAGYHVITAETTNTFSFVFTTGADEVGNTAQTNETIRTGNVSVHNVRVNMNDTATITADSGLGGTISNGTITELTDGDVLDSLANLRVAKFGVEAVLGISGDEPARSIVAATLNDYVIDTANNNRTNGDQVVRFGTTSNAVDGSITVTAWIDDDGDNVIDSTEHASDDVVVTFVKEAAVSFSTTIGDFFVGTGTTFEARTTADLNLKEIGAQSLLKVDSVLIDASTAAEDPSAEGVTTMTWDAVNEWLDASLTADAAVAVSDSMRLQLYAANGTTTVGVASTFGLGALTTGGTILSVLPTVNNTGATAIDIDGTGMPSQAITVRKGAASVSATLTAYTANPTAVADRVVVPNAPYTMVVTSSTVTAADGVKVNGKVVDGGSETITGRTSATGAIPITLTQTAADASDVVTVAIQVEGKTTAGLVAFTYEAASYKLYDSAGELGASTDYNTTAAVGGTVTRSYKVADQFGAAPADGAVAVTATSAGTRVTTAATWSYQVPVVNGIATVTIVDDGVGTGSEDVTLKTSPVLPGGGLGTVHDTDTYTITYAATAVDVTPTAVTATVNYDGIDDLATNDVAVTLEPDALVNFDSRATRGASAPIYETKNVDVDGDKVLLEAGDAQLTLTGTVSNVNGGVIAGTLVTVSGQGVGFKFATANNATVYTVDSITVRTTAAGTYSVDVYGGTGGLKTLSVTAGAATASDEVTFAAGGAVSAFTLTTPGASEPGKTVDVFINLTDAYGNPVEGATVTLSSTGPGYLLNTTGTTLATGAYNTKLLVGSNDSGTAVISATVTIAGVVTTKTSSIVIGVGAVAAADQKVNVGTFKGFVALYAKGYEGQKMSAIVAGKWIVVESLASDFERVVRFTGAGYTITSKIYIDGVQVGDAFTTVTK